MAGTEGAALGSGDGQAPPARNAAGDAAFPNPTEPIQGAEDVLPAAGA